MRIDHVIYGTHDLDAAAALIEAGLGLETVAGGRHEGHGTHNRIVPLGDGYLELLAIVNQEEDEASPLGAALLSHLGGRGDGLFAWAVEVPDVDPVAKRLGSEVIPIAREGLTARLAGLQQSLERPWLPFFIGRDHEVADPGVGSDAGGITWVEVACDREELDHRLGGDGLPVRVVNGEPGVRAVGIGDRELRSA